MQIICGVDCYAFSTRATLLSSATSVPSFSNYRPPRFLPRRSASSTPWPPSSQSSSPDFARREGTAFCRATPKPRSDHGNHLHAAITYNPRTSRAIVFVGSATLATALVVLLLYLFTGNPSFSVELFACSFSAFFPLFLRNVRTRSGYPVNPSRRRFSIQHEQNRWKLIRASGRRFKNKLRSAEPREVQIIFIRLLSVSVRRRIFHFNARLPRYPSTVTILLTAFNCEWK